jgi:asparagine synthase (glutamine-hydrolysing)
MNGIRGLIQLDAELEPDRRIWVDATLYYRDDLCRKLGLASEDGYDDTGLIAAAYEKWGEDCVQHLEGDFAFAIWDAHDRKLFCARDPYAMRPFYYYHSPGKLFAFASSARELFHFEQVPFAINEARVADFIVGELEWIDYTSSCYEQIYRLPPAHRLTVASSGISVAEYYTPEPGPVLPLTTDDEYCEAFLDVFSRAVEERVQNGSVGCTMSGGLDSTSIVAVANGRVHPYSLARPRGADCDESRRIYATLDSLGIRGTQVIADEPGDIFDNLCADLDDPFDGEYLFLKSLYMAARENGASTVLDGAGGDLVLNGSGHIVRLLQAGDYPQAWREIRGISSFYRGLPTIVWLLHFSATAFVPEVIKKPVRLPRRRWRERRWTRASLIAPEFAERVDIAGRFDRMRETFSVSKTGDTCLDRVRKIRPNMTAGRERYGRLAASAGIEARDPYLDQRVIDFCSSLPDRQLARDGWPKFLLRKAMANRLPDDVRWGRGKPHIGSLYNDTFDQYELDRGVLSLDYLARSLKGFVEPRALRRAWAAFESGRRADQVHLALILSRWLERNVTRPIEKYR